MDLPLFTDLNLTPELLKGIKRLGYERPSPIQAKTIPMALTGRDIVGLSQTGSGKTAAFVLPSLQQLDLKKKSPQILILCPTRELTVQVCEEVHRLGPGCKGLQAIPVYGGAPLDRQIRQLRQGVHLIVGTPGRLLDHLNRGTLKTEHIRIAILDEADRMLDMGFRDDMEKILGAIPGERQTLFFSATMNPQVEGLIRHFGKKPKYISIERKALTVASTEQSYYEVRDFSKVEVLSRLLDVEHTRLAIIFCNTKRMVDECCESLLARGYSADRLHGDITQKSRERVLKRFREGKIELLIATDVAARGLDIENVDAVFNFDLPYDPEDYVHRIGRTGRAGRAGRAASFIYGRDIYRLQAIERYIKQTIRRVKVPTQEDVEGRRAHVIFNSLRDRLESKKFESHEDFVDRLLDQGHTPTDIAGALFTMLREAQGRELQSIAEDLPQSRDSQRSRPPRSNKSRGRKGKPREFKPRDSAKKSTPKRKSANPKSVKRKPKRKRSGTSEN